MSFFISHLKNLGITPGQHILVHSSYRYLKKEFDNIAIDHVIQNLKSAVTQDGSLIMPAFTYCFVKKDGSHEIFDKENSASKVGAVSESFRTSHKVIRTSSPTHSFCMWGAITSDITAKNNPESPLGKNSVPEWLSKQKNSYILLLGVDFTAMSFCHYLETVAPVPWHDFSPWKHLNIENKGVSLDDIADLKQIPGCSKSFVNFQKYLQENGLLKWIRQSTLIPVSLLMKPGKQFFRENPQQLVCPPSTCQACDNRWEFYLTQLRQAGDQL